MSKYAIIRLQGRQYEVTEGQEILVDLMGETKNIEPEVLLVSDEGKVSVGKPTVKGAKVSVKVLEEEVKGVKVDVYKFKAKSRYKKHTGFRPKYTKLQIVTIA